MAQADTWAIASLTNGEGIIMIIIIEDVWKERLNVTCNSRVVDKWVSEVTAQKYEKRKDNVCKIVHSELCGKCGLERAKHGYDHNWTRGCNWKWVHKNTMGLNGTMRPRDCRTRNWYCKNILTNKEQVSPVKEITELPQKRKEELTSTMN